MSLSFSCLFKKYICSHVFYTSQPIILFVFQLYKSGMLLYVVVCDVFFFSHQCLYVTHPCCYISLQFTLQCSVLLGILQCIDFLFGHWIVNRSFLLHTILLWIFVCMIPGTAVEFLLGSISRLELLRLGYVNVHFTR